MELGAGGEYTATESMSSPETATILADLDGYGQRLAEGAAVPLATNIKLVSVCMRALPELLSGVLLHLLTAVLLLTIQFCSLSADAPRLWQHVIKQVRGAVHLAIVACYGSWGFGA